MNVLPDPSARGDIQGGTKPLGEIGEEQPFDPDPRRGEFVRCRQAGGLARERARVGQGRPPEAVPAGGEAEGARTASARTRPDA